jgi:hypothetical protein
MVKGLDILSEAPSFEIIIRSDINPLGRSKKRRIIEAPNEAMRIVHYRLREYLRSLPVKYSFATGSRPGNSPLKNVERHRQNRFFFLLDLIDAYHNIDLERLAVILCSIDPELTDQEIEVTAFLKRYCLSSLGGLAIGAPASPDFFNLYCAVTIDEPLSQLCREYGLTYTRYLDDLTLSSNKVIGRVKRKRIRDIIEQAGFTTHHRKAKVYDLRIGTIVITGVGLEYGGRMFLPRYFLRYLRGLLNLGMEDPIGLRHQIEGAMGVFRGLTKRRRNEIEQDIVRRYRRFRRVAALFEKTPV